jgi:hypothetical protein
MIFWANNNLAAPLLDAPGAHAHNNKLTRLLSFAIPNNARTPWAKSRPAARTGTSSALVRAYTRQTLKRPRLEVVLIHRACAKIRKKMT